MANAKLDQNSRPTLTALSSALDGTIVDLLADPITQRLLVDNGGSGSTNFIDNEVVAGSGTTFTLANTPIVGSEHIFAFGQRLTPGAGNDYTISGAIITTVNSFSSGSILSDYRK